MYACSTDHFYEQRPAVVRINAAGKVIDLCHTCALDLSSNVQEAVDGYKPVQGEVITVERIWDGL